MPAYVFEACALPAVWSEGNYEAQSNAEMIVSWGEGR